MKNNNKVRATIILMVILAVTLLTYLPLISQEYFNLQIEARGSNYVVIKAETNTTVFSSSSLVAVWEYSVTQLSQVPGNNMLFWGEGTFWVDGWLEGTIGSYKASDLWVKGAGINKTIIKVSDGIGQTIFHLTGSLNNFNLTDMTLDGNKWNTHESTGDDKRENNIYTAGLTNFLFERIISKDSLHHNFYIHSNSHNGVIRQTTLSGAGRNDNIYIGSAGILLSACYNVTLVDSLLQDNQDAVYFGYNNHDNRIVNDTISGAIKGDNYGNYGNVIEGCIIRGGWYTVSFYSYNDRPIHDITVRWNNIYSSQDGLGITGNGAYNMHIYENNITALRTPIRFYSTTYSDIYRNTLVGGEGYNSVESLSGSDYLNVTYNTVNLERNPISLVGSHNIVHDNGEEPIPPPPTGTLIIDSTPISAECFVNDSSWGITPQNQTIDTGTYEVSWADVSGYITPTPQTVDVLTNQTTVVLGTYEVIPPPPEGLLVIDSTPINAEFFVNGTSYGATPQTLILEVGFYQVSWANVTDYVTPQPQLVSVLVNQTTNVLGIYEEIPPLPSKYRLIVWSQPVPQGFTVTISNSTFSIELKTGQWSPYIDEGQYTVSVQSTVVITFEIWTFKSWSDGNINSSRIISLTSETILLYGYEKGA